MFPFHICKILWQFKESNTYSGKRLRNSRQEYKLHVWMYSVHRNYDISHRWQTQGPWAKFGPPPCFYPAAAPSSCLTVRSSYIYTVLKLHSVLWRQPQGWYGPWWKWVWHPWYRHSINIRYYFYCNILPSPWNKVWDYQQFAAINAIHSSSTLEVNSPKAGKNKTHYQGNKEIPFSYKVNEYLDKCICPI